MKNKTLAIFGIGTYLLSVITSASDLEGNPVVPVALILISGLADLLFTIMATVRLWKSARNVSIIFASSRVVLFILGMIQEFTLPSYGAPIIVLSNIVKVISFIVFVLVIKMLLFGNPKIEGDELKRCLAYYEAQLRVTAFHTKEADLFNNALVKYLNSVKENPVAANEMCKAADRLVQAAHEVNRRHEEIQPIPDAASAMHFVWRVTFQSVTAWAEANLSSIEALANGMTPDKAYVQHLVDEYQAAWRKAQEEDKKFLRRVKVTAGEIERILSRTDEATAADSWQPKPRDYDCIEVSKTAQQA